VEYVDTHKHSINAQLFPKTLDMVEIGRTRVRPLFRRRNDKTVMEREMKLTSFYCFYVFISDILFMLAQFYAITVLWTSVSARILVLVLQLYERNKLKLKRLGVCSHFARLNCSQQWRN